MTRILITSDVQPIQDLKDYAQKLGLNVDEFREYTDKQGNPVDVWQVILAPHPKLSFFIMRLDGRFEIEYSPGATLI
jgi:hypothetical protein